MPQADAPSRKTRSVTSDLSKRRICQRDTQSGDTTGKISGKVAEPPLVSLLFAMLSYEFMAISSIQVV